MANTTFLRPSAAVASEEEVSSAVGDFDPGRGGKQAARRRSVASSSGQQPVEKSTTESDPFPQGITQSFA